MESAKRFSFRQSPKAASAVSRAERCAMALLLRLHAGASNRVIVKSELTHRFRIQQVSSIEDDWRPHFFFQDREVHVAKFIPVRSNDQRFGISDCFDSG